ncbi:ABC transporter ATP-binding protein [Helicovermis profundi]|uniref:ABC transporter ATP-binding protein n=1 Tax=Helicovermis profundi TaxID=3065157 RepID=A0AAU9E147_9FIRM|nr:ABC transporter ATP-binding protein [Clostridia bacterium S502]
MPDNVLLKVNNLKTHFYTDTGVVKAVDGISFDLKKGHTIGIVGESGSGKSITAMSIMRLIPVPPGRIVDGEILFKGKDFVKSTQKEMMKIRGNEVAMIFQDPMTSLNPVLKVGEQIAEAIRLHQNLDKKKAWSKSIEMLEKVGIPEAADRANRYPHEFSGGMRQRAMIAMALSCNPELLIADEPTTALDVTIQAQILDLMLDLKNEFNTAIIMITHDLGVVAEVCDEVLVMYAGRPVEKTDVNTLFESPKHPYTWGLLNSIPSIDDDKERLEPIHGLPPDLRHLPKGCSFADRCDHSKDICFEKKPELVEIAKGHFVACNLYGERD